MRPNNLCKNVLEAKITDISPVADENIDSSLLGNAPFGLF
jgi:hypothetical protein